MKKLIPIVATLIIIVAVSYKYNKLMVIATQRWLQASFCDRPIKYAIGSIDSQFSITQKDFALAIAQAEQLWEKAINKNLFENATDGSLLINLVYDGRQTIVNDINNLNSSVEEQKAKIDKSNQLYEQQRDELEQRLKKLNDEIDYWNKKGGAPKDEYNRLVAAQKKLESEIEQLNAFANKINSSVDQINQQVHSLNSNVTTYNSIISVKPEIGVYTSGLNTIDIFFYSSNDELVHVLAHELGHALGLDHVQGDDSIMNPLASPVLMPSQLDVTELTQFCTNKNRLDLIKSDIKNLIYTLRGNLAKSSY